MDDRQHRRAATMTAKGDLRDPLADPGDVRQVVDVKGLADIGRDPLLNPCDAPFAEEVTPELTRYSAQTFNGRRIHYNRDYATAVKATPAWWCAGRSWRP